MSCVRPYTYKISRSSLQVWYRCRWYQTMFLPPVSVCFSSSSCCVPQGFSKAMGGFVKLGLINTEPNPVLQHPTSTISWVWIAPGNGSYAVLCSVLRFSLINLFYLIKWLKSTAANTCLSVSRLQWTEASHTHDLKAIVLAFMLVRVQSFQDVYQPSSGW